MNTIFISLLLYRIMKDFNLPQVNSVAPMSLASHNDFVAHQKTTYPFSNTAPIPTFFQICLTSSERISGDAKNANFFVKLDKPLPTNAVLCVKDFTILYDEDTLDENKTFIVTLPQLLAKNSYMSYTNGASDFLCAGSGSSYHNDVNIGSAGVTITDAHFFNNKNITINIKSNADIDDWVLIMYLYGYE
jgi:hypothetical protein